MHIAYLLTGGNSGNREEYLHKARAALAQHNTLLATSDLYQTAAWGLEDQPDFLNQALKIETALKPAGLLHHVLGIEAELGRRRGVKYGPRAIDIDILFYDDAVVSEEGLIVPHPQVAYRRFALRCLADIAPDLIHPVLGRSIEQLLQDCRDPLPVQRLI